MGLTNHCGRLFLGQSLRNLCVAKTFPGENNFHGLRARMEMTNSFKNLDWAAVPGPVGEIPRKLKQYYDALQGEAIPDRLLDLLERLDEAERAQTSRQASAEEFE